MDITIPPCNHTSHFINITLRETKEDRCEECGGEISGTAFTCDCCNVWKHISCADKLNRDLPLEIIHPLHLQHRLQLQWLYYWDFICDKCLYISTGYRYRCYSCDFNLDLTCASSPLRFKDGKKKTIFHYSHHEELSFFKYRKVRKEDYELCYGCTFCKFYLHQVCGDKIPMTLSHSFHPKHPLRLTYPFVVCIYKCNVCSKWSNDNIPLYKYEDLVYYCQSCTFIAHIQCVLDQDNVASGKVPSLSPPPMENKVLFVDEMEQNEGTKCHPHSDMPWFLPANLSYEIRHPFHSSHPLNLYTSYYLGGQLTACDKCRDICRGFIYFCEQCNFKLDMKCAALTTHKTGVLEEKKMDRVTELHHFTHPHKLVLGNRNYPDYKTQCIICKLQILGLAYFCPTCNYILHESCHRLPQKIQVPFHLNRMLVSRMLPTFGSSQRCYACPLYLELGGFVYSCEHYHFNIHVTCANSLRRPLKYIVKSKYHSHPLILKDSFIEDDSEKYYCDFCEEEKIPNDNIYYYEECNGQTIAHIKCVLAKVS
ncbi:hypothetical protein V6Z12_D11G313800 [Gossypium hirsutum]